MVKEKDSQKTKSQKKATPPKPDEEKKKDPAKTSGNKMTKEIADTLVGEIIEVSAYGDDLTGFVDSVNLIDGNEFLRLNTETYSVGILVSEIKKWKVIANQNPYESNAGYKK